MSEIVIDHIVGQPLGAYIAIAHERGIQDKKWGEQNHPNGTGTRALKRRAEMRREDCNKAFKNGVGTWKDILDEEIHEAFAESDPKLLREELIQSAAVIVAWIEALDRSGA